MELLLLFLGAALVNNFVLTRFLGICPFLGVSKKIETAIGMGMAVTFVMGIASMISYIVYEFILQPLHLEYLYTV
ncbi:MAG: Rnf-Nqr domain containing protein, partial [Zhenhengia sp.]